MMIENRAFICGINVRAPYPGCLVKIYLSRERALPGAMKEDIRMTMDNLSKLEKKITRSISPENFTGEKGKGGICELKDGNARRAARGSDGRRCAGIARASGWSG